MAPKPCAPAYFGAFLARSWAEGTTKVRHLFSDIRHRGYTESYSHLVRFLACLLPGGCRPILVSVRRLCESFESVGNAGIERLKRLDWV
jgi:hypothetical protein